MRTVRAALLFFFLAGSLLAAEVALTEAQQNFQKELADRTAALEKRDGSATAGEQGWFFLTSELRFLAQGPFWGAASAQTGRSRKAPDPLPAIIDFQRQLHERGIELLLVPVPPKAAIYPEKISSHAQVKATDSAPFLHAFYDELRAHGVDVLDLTPIFAAARGDETHGAIYCQSDSHWSGAGCVLAAHAIAERIRDKFPAITSRQVYAAEWKQATINGDLAALIPPNAGRPGPEQLSVRAISDQASGAAVQPDAKSPLLLLGDSHTLAFHEFLAERAGLVDQLAEELGFAPDLIGTRGSGATAVRVSLYRRTRSVPGYLAQKKVVVWCFAAREFTEADQGWVVQPVGN
ncbi:MAG TPA: hypothetical protein VK474_12175 [Chthoniobacterales bacterium]|nr:hypothetical protein [Chthoniobacterales bacterium]